MIDAGEMKLGLDLTQGNGSIWKRGSPDLLEVLKWVCLHLKVRLRTFWRSCRRKKMKYVKNLRVRFVHCLRRRLSTMVNQSCHHKDFAMEAALSSFPFDMPYQKALGGTLNW